MSGFDNAIVALDYHPASLSAPLDSMMTVRTSRVIGQRVIDIWRNHPNVLKADILRALFDSMLPIAERRGMAYVMQLREEAL